MEGYRINHNLNYRQFSDVIDELLFRNLNFNKNFVKYYCKKLIQNLAIHQEKFIRWKKNIFVANQRVTEENSLWLQNEVDIKVLTKTLKS